jgi:two-component system catabolic regulation response regulator CreB
VTLKILVVEDEPAIADNVGYALTTEGFEVAACSTGRDALARLDAGDIALIVLDVGLPDVSGFEVCKQIRRASSTPIIFLTARADEIDRIVGLEIGGDDYMVKPFSPRELAARVKVILRRVSPDSREDSAASPPAAPAAPRDAHGPFAIDRNRMKIIYHGMPLELSRYEFGILETLIRRPGWVFSRNQLMDRVGGEDTPSLERTIDSHIKTLRAKLREIDPQIDPIETHRGFGYALREFS